MLRPSISLVFIILLFSWATNSARADDFGTFGLYFDLFKSNDGDSFFKRDSDEKKREERREYELKKDDAADDRRDFLRKFWNADFTDTDFSKNNFTDLKLNPGRAVFMDQSGKDSGDKDSGDVKKRDDDRSFLDFAGGPYSADDDDWRRMAREKAKREDDRKYKDFTTPDPYMLQDWVPSKVDRLDNGGFTIADDNGSPVPYNLNGFVEIERDFPWGGEP